MGDNGFQKSSRQKLESRLQKLQFDVDVMLRLFFAAARSTPLKTLKPRSTINSKHPLTNHTLDIVRGPICSGCVRVVSTDRTRSTESAVRPQGGPPHRQQPQTLLPRHLGREQTTGAFCQMGSASGNLGLWLHDCKGNIMKYDNGYTIAFKYTAANLKQSMTPRTVIGDWRETSGGQSPISSGFVFTDLGDASGRHQLVFASGDSIWQADLMLKRSVKMIIAATWNQNGVLKVFINGKEEASEVAQARFSAEYEIDPYPSITIGYRNDEPETNKATVAIQDLAIWEKILSEAELKEYGTPYFYSTFLKIYRPDFYGHFFNAQI